MNFHKDPANVTFKSTLEYYPGVLLSCVAFGIAFRHDSGNVTLWSNSGVLPCRVILECHAKNVTFGNALGMSSVFFSQATIELTKCSPSESTALV